MQFKNLILRPAGRQSVSNSENCEKCTTPHSPPFFQPPTRTQAPAVAGHPAADDFTPTLSTTKTAPATSSRNGGGVV